MTTLEVESVCVADFCGTYHHELKFDPQGRIVAVASSHSMSYWADYWPSLGVTRFGGAWFDVPDLHSSIEPTEAQIEAHVKASGWTCEAWLVKIAEQEARL